MYVHVVPNPPPDTRYAAIQRHLADLGEPRYRFAQIARVLIDRGATTFEEMAELPRHVRAELARAFGPQVPTLRPLATQSGPPVEKVLFAAACDARVETVLVRYRAGWTSLCVSTQVGCGLGCTFCASGAVGLRRNLTADEICDQVLHFRRRGRVDSVSFMGMGEALANPHTFPAIQMLTDPGLFGVGPRRVTVSTVGFVPGLVRLTREHPRVTLTLSVHSPYEGERSRIIPLGRRFPLAASLEVLDRHVAVTRRKVYLGYLLLDGVNDSEDHVEGLAGLVRARSRPDLFHVSLIPYNEAAGVTAPYRRPSEARVRGFLHGLAARGVHATRRRQLGGEIDAACGQLHARYLLDTRARGAVTSAPSRSRAGAG